MKGDAENLDAHNDKMTFRATGTTSLRQIFIEWNNSAEYTHILSVSITKGTILSVTLANTFKHFRLEARGASQLSFQGWESLRVLDIKCPLIDNVVMKEYKEREDLVMSVK